MTPRRMTSLSASAFFMAHPTLHKVRSTIWLRKPVKSFLVRKAETDGTSEAELVEKALVAYYHIK